MPTADSRLPHTAYCRLPMKSTTPAVINLINAARAAPDAPIAFAECFTFITTTGTQYTWTNVDYPVTYNGSTFLADGPLVQGLKYKGASDSRSTSSRSPSPRGRRMAINGAPFLIALRDGAFDGAPVYRDRVFLTAPSGSGGRRRAHVPRPRLDGRQCRAHASDADGCERSRDPRLRHAAEPVFADLPAHAL